LYIFIVPVALFILYSCEEAGDYYLGMNQQPEITINTFEEGLNIFGLLRPDFRGDYNKSFVFVQQNWPVLKIDSVSIIRNVFVSAYRIENDVVVDTVYFPFMPSDSLFTDTLYRTSEAFHPEAGQRFRLICDHPDFPLASGETIIPSKPEIEDNSMNINEGILEFTILKDTLIKMMDIYLITESYSMQAARYVPVDTADTQISISLPDIPLFLRVKIFSYDNKLATYYANSNTSLNFNKYRTTFSTLESGFGVFGSLNFTEIEIYGN